LEATKTEITLTPALEGEVVENLAAAGTQTGNCLKIPKSPEKNMANDGEVNGEVNSSQRR
jgi:hypothetical protein